MGTQRLQTLSTTDDDSQKSTCFGGPVVARDIAALSAAGQRGRLEGAPNWNGAPVVVWLHAGNPDRYQALRIASGQGIGGS